LSQGGAVQLVDGIVMMITTIIDNFALILPPLRNAIIAIVGEVAKELTNPSTIKLVVQSVLTIIGAVAVAIGGALPTIWNMIKGVLTNLGELLGNNIYSAVTTIKTAFTTIIDTVKGWGDSIKQRFTSIFENARNIVKSAIDKIKSFFKFEWSLPKIKLPHFSIKGKFSLDPPQIPSFGVSWYAKAMNEPFVLNNPTIFGAMNGNLLGGGERGSELVVGVDKLMQMIADAKGSQNITINAYCREGQDVKAFAEEVAYALEDIKARKAAVYG
jgi:Flp pilus assembly pilin Flp